MENQKKSIRDSLLKIVRFLNENNIENALIGGIAFSIFYEPRATFDIDFIVNVEDINYFINILKQNKNFIFIHNEQMKFQNATIERVIYENDIVIDFLIADDEFKKSIFLRKKEIKIDNEKIYIVSIEDLILLKFLSNREQDYLDIKNLLTLNGLDIDYIKYWLKILKIDTKNINLNNKIDTSN